MLIRVPNALEVSCEKRDAKPIEREQVADLPDAIEQRALFGSFTGSVRRCFQVEAQCPTTAMRDDSQVGHDCKQGINIQRGSLELVHGDGWKNGKRRALVHERVSQMAC